MKAHLSLTLIVFLALTFSLISSVYASDGDLELSNVPQQLADRLGISLFAGQMLSGFMLMFIPLLIIATITRGKNTMLLVIVGLSTLCLGVALTWLPLWTLLITALIVALLFASNMRSWLSGA